MLDWIILASLVFQPLVYGVLGLRSKNKTPASKNFFYLRDIIISTIILSLYYLACPALYQPINFSTISKGINIPRDMLSALIPMFVMPLLMSFTPWDATYPKDPSSAKEIFGWPTSHLPETWQQYFLFIIYILVGVIFEEALCRQFIFYSLNHQLGLQGDYLVIISAVVFALGHLYQGWLGVLSSFTTGVLLGKVFLTFETINYPFILHLALNLTMAVVAFRWIKDKRKMHKKNRHDG